MINLYSYLYPQLEAQGCNTCAFQAIFHGDNEVKIKVHVHASICVESELMVTARNSQHEIMWQKQIDINCQPEKCPFSDFSDLSYSNGRSQYNLCPMQSMQSLQLMSKVNLSALS